MNKTNIAEKLLYLCFTKFILIKLDFWIEQTFDTVATCIYFILPSACDINYAKKNLMVFN